jgi:hypothetical protein
MAEEMTVKLRSRDGSPIRVDVLARQIAKANCEIVAVPTKRGHHRIEKPAGGWPSLRSVPTRASTAPDFGPEASS